MPSGTRYTAAELARLSGVSERTVRYYVEEGLLPRPAGRGRGANFLEDHLTRLRLIRAMQDAGNDLETIGVYLEELEAEVRERGRGFEEALSIWTARREADLARSLIGRFHPVPVNRMRVAEGVEILIDGSVRTPSPAKLANLAKAIREAFDLED